MQLILILNGFQGKEGQSVPDMSENVIMSISDRYIELYEVVTGKTFEKKDMNFEQIEATLTNEISKLF